MQLDLPISATLLEWLEREAKAVGLTLEEMIASLLEEARFADEGPLPEELHQ